MHVLGIDAGGTKTVCLLADENGTVLNTARGGEANLQAVGELELEKVLHDVMTSALGDSEISPAAVCLGIAGVDRSDDAVVVNGIMRRIGFKTKTLVVNDALVALVAGAADNPGIVLIAGTGSIAYGRNAAGYAARAGGWGYLIGDEGSGYWMGRMALAAVVRQFDGRGPATLLRGLVIEHLNLATPGDLIERIYHRGLHRHAISDIAALVQQAADSGDAVACEILARAGVELANAAGAVIEQLGMRGESFPTILAGSIFRGVPRLANDVSQRLAETAPRSEVRLLGVEPAVGAVHLALLTARGGVTIPPYLVDCIN